MAAETKVQTPSPTEQSGLRDQESVMRDALTNDIAAPPAPPDPATEAAAVVAPESAASSPPTPSTIPSPPSPPPSNALAPASSDRSRLFIVCGRGRKPDELRQLFSECGEIKNLHFALDRSNKSRGFAFLQYKDPSCAVAAIEKFHLMTLEDGHVLKVTVAKDKPVVAVGKLKRNQQSSHDVHSESESNVEEPHIPGKRQRSSAPVSSRAAAPRRKMRVDNTVDGLFDKSCFAEMQPRVPSTPSEPVISPEKEVASVLEDVLLTVQSAGNTGSIANLTAGYSLIAEHRRQTLTAVGTGRSEGLDDGDEKIEADKSYEQEETSTEQLTSSINSFTLDGTPTTSILPSEKLNSNLLSSIGAPSSSVHRKRAAKVSLLRRRRQSFDDSDSSADGGESDAIPSRRKRSNISRREPSSWFTKGEHADRHILSAPLSTLASSHLLTPVKSKKQCKRQSSDQSADVSTRSSKQRVTSTRSYRTAAFNSMALTSGGMSSTPTVKPTTSRTKLFFTSSHKFTMQELEAMFAVYGDFEFVDIVKSFGRVKTMAYIKYSNPQTASAVIESFQEEHEQEAEHASQGEFMKLSFAEDNRRNAASPFLHMRQLDHEAFSPMVRPLAGAAAGMTPLPIETMGEKLWLLILYDRSLPSNVISACVSKCVGMEFVDIKVFRSTGESQGVAFVKFESEAQAVDASRELHQTELPTGSGKFLQVIVIQDPSLFSTMHGGSHGAWSGEHGGGGEGRDDVDLSAVEVKFAHLMRSNDQNGNLPAGHGRSRMSIDETSTLTARAALQHPAALMYPPEPAAASFFGAMPLHPMQPQLQLQQQYPQHIYGYYPQHQQHQQPLVVQTQHGQPHSYMPSPWPAESPPSYYNTSYPSPQMAYPPPPEYYNQQQVYPAQAVNGDENSGTTILETDSPPTTGASSDSSADGAQLSPPAIYISSGRPLELISVVKALEDCSGVVAITKDGEDSDAVFIVEFTDPPLAADAVKKLDGKMCNGKKLRVATMSSSMGGKPRAASSRRKRQRVDLRARKQLVPPRTTQNTGTVGCVKLQGPSISLDTDLLGDSTNRVWEERGSLWGTGAIDTGVGVMTGAGTPSPLLAPLLAPELLRSSAIWLAAAVGGEPVVVVVVHPDELLHRVLVEMETEVLLPPLVVMFCMVAGTLLTVTLILLTTGTPFTVDLLVLVLADPKHDAWPDPVEIAMTKEARATEMEKMRQDLVANMASESCVWVERKLDNERVVLHSRGEEK